MVDQDKIDAVRTALGMEKRAQATSAPTQSTPPEPGVKLAGLERLRVLPGISKAGVAGLARNIKLAQTAFSKGQPFEPQELRQFMRHGIDPAKLRFLPDLAGMRAAMSLQ